MTSSPPKDCDAHSFSRAVQPVSVVYIRRDNGSVIRRTTTYNPDNTNSVEDCELNDQDLDIPEDAEVIDESDMAVHTGAVGAGNGDDDRLVSYDSRTDDDHHDDRYVPIVMATEVLPAAAVVARVIPTPTVTQTAVSERSDLPSRSRRLDDYDNDNGGGSDHEGHSTSSGNVSENGSRDTGSNSGRRETEAVGCEESVGVRSVDAFRAETSYATTPRETDGDDDRIDSTPIAAAALIDVEGRGTSERFSARSLALATGLAGPPSTDLWRSWSTTSAVEEEDGRDAEDQHESGNAGPDGNLQERQQLTTIASMPPSSCDADILQNVSIEVLEIDRDDEQTYDADDARQSYTQSLRPHHRGHRQQQLLQLSDDHPLASILSEADSESSGIMSRKAWCCTFLLVVVVALLFSGATESLLFEFDMIFDA